MAGNECSRGLGFERLGLQSGCPPQLDHLSFLAQAGAENQGTWDSNYQIDDDFSWFIPGKKGDHQLKFGARYNYTEVRRVSQNEMNGVFRFNTDLPFDPANPRTYPERLTIRLAEFETFVKGHTIEASIEAYAQDKWKMGGRTTLSLGIRYDLEILPTNNTDNPLFATGNKEYPADRNNFAPRFGLTRALDDQDKSVVRAGYGLFYNRTLLGAIDDAFEFSKFLSSATVTFPNDTADPGPSANRFPTDPFLVNGPVLNGDLLNQRYPPGTLLRNGGVVVFDSPDRKQPYAHQATVGYGRELTRSTAVQIDYIHMQNKDMFLSRNLNPMVRANTSRTGPITRVDAFGVLGDAYPQQVWVMENTGESKYDALNLSLEKRYANNWSGRISYSLSSSRGTADNQADRNTSQVLTDLKLDERWGPANVDRRHILSLNGRTEIPRTGGITVSSTMRYMSGAPFTILDSSIDADRNGELIDPVPAGTYSGTALNAMQNVKSKGGRNGATGPDYFQLDVRAGWRGHMSGNRVLEIFLDIFNITNRVNWANPSGDRRIAPTFLQLTNLYGGSGFPRQAQFGVRMMF